MPYQATVYRILISSPSDVEEEREAIKQVIYSWNNVNSFDRKVILEPVLWETHAYPEMGDRPQGIINKQIVKDCDILIGVFWSRIGTPTGKAESGTVEEINEFINAEKPVHLYFSSADIPQNSDRSQYDRLQIFKKDCIGKGICWEYKSVDNLRNLLQGHLTLIINRIHKPITDNQQQVQNDDENSEKKALKIYKERFESFLRKLEIEWKAERDSEPSNIDEGKYILQDASSDVLLFRSLIIETKGTDLIQILDESAKKLKAIQRHELYLNGGKSFEAFWVDGNEIIELLKRIPEELNKTLI